MNQAPPTIARGLFGRMCDSLLFPIRALFIPETSRFGLSSLRDERMRLVAKHAAGRLLDVGCGPGNMFATYFHKDGIGVDVFAYPGVEHVVPDMTKLPFSDGEFDTITLIAVGGHIPRGQRQAQFVEFARVLKPGGILIMTEGEPITQTLSHRWRSLVGWITGHKGMDDERGMEHEEEYCMPRNELMGYLNGGRLQFESRDRFMWFLNNIYIARRK